ncbi:hypothetical protein B0A69_06230 [Chryseobacterium shigense]|nr:hypothetical protein B0A69_06230 [Chryseobacterium shigense]
MSASKLLDQLKIQVQEHSQLAKNLLHESEVKLNSRASHESWSVLECLEHLNRYGNFYIPGISHRISASKTSPSPVFKPGILGNYFAQSMLPKEKLNKMKTFKNMDPINSQLDKRVVEEFIRQQDQLLELLTKARNIDLNKVKTSISISKLIKLKLGDTFRFVIYHNERHILQIKKIMKSF